MDRKLNPSQRSGKSKLSHHAGDLFALGSKQSSSSSKDISDKRNTSMPISKPQWDSSSSSKVSSLIASKREAPTSSASAVPSKKPKLVTALTRPLPQSASTVTAPVVEPWEAHTAEFEAPELVILVLQAHDDNQTETVVNTICGALKLMKSPRWKFDSVLYFGLCYLGKLRPKIFLNSTITSALCSLLKRESNTNIKTRTNLQVPVLAANLLARAYQDKKDWPINFVKCYVEDALNERAWVDHDDCKLFVGNVLTAFNTIIPAQHLLQNEATEVAKSGLVVSGVSSPLTMSDDESSENSPMPLKQSQDIEARIMKRYANCDGIETYMVEMLKDSINKRTSPTDFVTKNTLKLMSAACGLVEIRLLAVSRLEVWLHNAKLMKPAQELLAYLCYNFGTKTQKDIEVVIQYVKIRLKTKPLCNSYLSCLKAIVKENVEIMNLLMKHTIFNEFSNARNPNNISMVVLMFQEQPDKAPVALAEIYKEYLLNRDDCLRALRLFLRELVRALRYDVNLYLFCFTLVSKDRAFNTNVENFDARDRVLSSISDLFCLCMLLGISPQVKEASSSCSRGDKKDLNVLQSYQLQVSRIQFEAIRWMEKVVPGLYKPPTPEYLGHIRKLLFLENNYEPYVKIDTWPPESERGLFFKLVGEVRVHQNTLLRLCKIGQQKSCPMPPMDALEICEQMVKRSGDLTQDYLPLMHFDKVEIIDNLFRLTQYHYPDNITLPYGYSPPTLAVTVPYWKAWGIVLILAAHNPMSIGVVCWEQYPILRTLMEMCITNQFVYPPPTSLCGQNFPEEREIERLEKQEIIELETHLAAATTQMKITEETSLLVNQLMRYDPTGPPRKPTSNVLENLALLNKTHNLGHLFCRSREPDFLMDIIQRQGNSQSMPWLAELVENSESVSLLPVQCLCEFLLSPAGGNQDKHIQLLHHLQELVTNPECSPQTACEVLDYFLRRLASPQKSSRMQSVKGLKMLLSCVSTEEARGSGWLIKQLPMVPHFEHIRMQVITALRAACQIDMIPENIVHYLRFLAQHTTTCSEEEMSELVLDLAQLVVERVILMNSIMTNRELNEEAKTSLLTLYCSYLNRVKIPRGDETNVFPQDSQDVYLIKWSTGEECFMVLNVVHAMILLLTYDGGDRSLNEMLLDAWFPADLKLVPRGFTYDATTNEIKENSLYPDWILLRMVQSPVQRLVDASLRSIRPVQLLMFMQSFGYSLQSMGKCLKVLDNWAASEQAACAGQIMENGKPFIGMCIAVQHMRGVADGKVFLRVCNIKEEKYPIILLKRLQDIDITSYIHKNPVFCKPKMQQRSLRSVLNEMLFEQPNSSTEYTSWILRKIAVEQKEKTLRSNSVLFQVLKFIKDLDDDRLLSLFVVKSPLLLSLFHLLLSNSSEFVKDLLFCIFHKAIIKTNVMFDTSEVLYRLLRNTILQNDAPKSGINTITNLKTTPIENLESYIKDLVLNKTNNDVQDSQIVDCICSWLLEDDSDLDSQSDFKTQIERSQKNGMLIDWVAAIEPNMVNSNSKVQMDLLFSSKADKKGFRPYLLTLLTHQANWSTLAHCVNFLLSKTYLDYDSSAVLDFLMTLISNPKLWQGRDKVISKRNPTEDVLELSIHKILTVLDYALLEALCFYKTGTKDDVIKRIDLRLPLLLHCMRNDQHIVKVVVQYLYMQLVRKDIEIERRRVVAQFLIQLYMIMPVIVLYQPGLNFVVNNTDVKHSVTSCKIDTMCQSIFTALSSTPLLKDWHRKSQDLDMLARKVSAVHPNIVLRHLSMIASSLQGRIHLEFAQFRSRYHLALFNHIIGILELLTPMLFRKEHQKDLEIIISLYINLFRRHISFIKDLTNLAVRFFNLLQNYINYCPKRALGYIKTHSSTLQDLHITLPHLQNLKNIANGVSLLHQHKAHKNNIEEMCLEMGMVTMNILPVQAEPCPIQFNTLANSLSKVQVDEVIAALQELDHITNKKPELLIKIIEPICALINSTSQNVRNLSHTLLLRHLKYSPQSLPCTNICFTSLMTSLKSSDPDIRTSSLERIQDYIICLQEHSLLILQTLFRMGVQSKANTMPYISKCVTALKLQDGN